MPLDELERPQRKYFSLPSLLKPEALDPQLCAPAQWLGTSSGAPSSTRNVSSILLRSGRDSFMVDAGEGTARQLMRANLDASTVRRYVKV